MDLGTRRDACRRPLADVAAGVWLRAGPRHLQRHPLPALRRPVQPARGLGKTRAALGQVELVRRGRLGAQTDRRPARARRRRRELPRRAIRAIPARRGPIGGETRVPGPTSCCLPRREAKRLDAAATAGTGYCEIGRRRATMRKTNRNIGRARRAVVVAAVGLPLLVLPTLGASAGLGQACRGEAVTIFGTQGRDVIRGTAREDSIMARGGNDVIRGLGAKDEICAGPGEDRLLGGPGKDGLDGGAGADVALGRDGNDDLIGAGGADRLDSGPGPDEVRGGPGSRPARRRRPARRHVRRAGPRPGPWPGRPGRAQRRSRQRRPQRRCGQRRLPAGRAADQLRVLTALPVR